MFEKMGMMIYGIIDDFLIDWIILVVFDVKYCLKCSIEKCKNILIYIYEGNKLKLDVIKMIEYILFFLVL